MGMDEFVKAFEAAQNVTNVNFLNIAGYNAGLVIQKALETSTSLKQEDLRAAVADFSGQLNTLDGAFKIDATAGAQVGELLQVAQFQPSGGALKVAWYAGFCTDRRSLLRPLSSVWSVWD
jgi:branched-chain amino acid transport system substrate-binding protein